MSCVLPKLAAVPTTAAGGGTARRSASVCSTAVAAMMQQLRAPPLPLPSPSCRRRRCRPRGAPAAAGSGDAAAVPPPPPQPSQQRWKLPAWLPGAESAALAAACWRVLRDNAAAVVAIYAIKDAAVYVLHRVAQRATNAAAAGVMGVELPPLANPWYLLLDSGFMDAQPGEGLFVFRGG